MKKYSFSINNTPYDVLIKEVNDETVVAEVNGVEHTVAIESIQNTSPQSLGAPAPVPPAAPKPAELSSPPIVSPPAKPHGAAGEIVSPIPGQIIGISVSQGDAVRHGQKLLTLEAMKLENAITADRDGLVKDIMVREGDVVNQGSVLVVLE